MRCRLCADAETSSSTLRSMWLESGEATHLVQVAETLFGVRVDRDDVSTSICEPCVAAVDGFHAYYARVKQAQAYFAQCVAMPKQYELQEYTTINDANILKNEDVHLLNRNEFFYDSLKSEEHPFDKFDDAIDHDHNDAPDDYPSEVIDKDLSSSSSSPLRFDKTIQRSSSPPSKNVNRKTRKKSRVQSLDNIDDDIMVIKDSKDVSNFPGEVIKNGKMVFKGAKLDLLICKFYNIECDVCIGRPKFKSLNKMMKHYNSDHNTKGYVMCCDSRLYQHRSIYLHMARHLQPTAFECPICKKAVSRPHSLKLHLRTHLPEEEKPYKCDQCEKSFISTDLLKRHKMTHIPIENRKTYECKICLKIFTLSVSYLAHVRDAHTSMKFLCSECGHSFTKKAELSVHMLKHDTTGKHEIQCQLCGFVCKNKQTFRIHTKLHTADRLRCTMCDYTTHRQNQLNVHMRVRHTDEKPFTCAFCGKQFKIKKVLETHIALHTGERKYSCSYCTRAFSSQGNYYTHMKKDHPKQHQKITLNRQKKKFREIVPVETKNTNDADESRVHEMARMYLQKIAEQNSHKKL